MKKLVLLMTLGLISCGGGSDGIDRDAMVVKKLGNIPGPGACGVSNAYLVAEAAGVDLSPNATINGKTAKQLDAWLRNQAVPIIGKRGGGLVGIQVAAHYACRTRNSLKGAKLSEHAKGNAIDISAFILADGSRITVLGWRGKDAKVLRQLHASACGPFGTVLGPDSDRFHQDHFHFDTADYRSGSYCR